MAQDASEGYNLLQLCLLPWLLVYEMSLLAYITKTPPYYCYKQLVSRRLYSQRMLGKM